LFQFLESTLGLLPNPFQKHGIKFATTYIGCRPSNGESSCFKVRNQTPLVLLKRRGAGVRRSLVVEAILTDTYPQTTSGFSRRRSIATAAGTAVAPLGSKAAGAAVDRCRPECGWNSVWRIPG